MAFWKKDVFEASCQTEEPSPTTGANDGAAEPEPRYYWRQTPIADDEPRVKFTREFSRSAISAQFGGISVMTRGYLGGEQIYDLDGHYLGYKPGASGRVESDGLGFVEYFIPCRIGWVGIRAARAGLARKTIGGAVEDGVRVGVVRNVPITDPSRLLGRIRDRLLNRASDGRLKNAIRELYRKKATVGNGSAMDAYRSERATGRLLSSSGHGKRLLERRTQLMRLLRDRSITAEDRAIIRELLVDIQDALSGGGL
ncbi:MAG: hypothetical protein IT175_05205 [Acidobacteria bacterium]|nr:hypothetical protein [Acidobacteriota bacterium]